MKFGVVRRAFQVLCASELALLHQAATGSYFRVPRDAAGHEFPWNRQPGILIRQTERGAILGSQRARWLGFFFSISLVALIRLADLESRPGAPLAADPDLMSRAVHVLPRSFIPSRRPQAGTPILKGVLQAWNAGRATRAGCIPRPYPRRRCWPEEAAEPDPHANDVASHCRWLNATTC